MLIVEGGILAKYYKCQVLQCKNLTQSHLCSSCIQRIVEGSDVTACSRCGSVLEIRSDKNKEVLWVEGCSICKGKRKNVPWEYLPVQD